MGLGARRGEKARRGRATVVVTWMDMMVRMERRGLGWNHEWTLICTNERWGLRGGTSSWREGTAWCCGVGVGFLREVVCFGRSGCYGG